MANAARHQFVCQNCGAVAARWAGKCVACGEWNTMIEEADAAAAPGSGLARSSKGRVVALETLARTDENFARIPTGLAELDRVTGGGIVPGSALLIGGEPGIGKSTLLLQVAAHVAKNVGPVLYSSGEESEHQIKLRGERLGVDRSPLYLLARIGLAAVILLPPTLLMGATLPWLVAWGVRSGRAFGRSLGVLYGINTLGAVLGASSAGFFLIPQLGLRASTYLVGAIALAVGLALSLWGRRETPFDRKPAATGEARPRASLPVFLLVGLSGAVALVLEVAWARIFGLIFGSSVYSFALVLAAYLLGVALGSLWWGGRFADSKRPWLAFAVLQALGDHGAVQVEQDRIAALGDRIADALGDVLERLVLDRPARRRRRRDRCHHLGLLLLGECEERTDA